MVYIFDPAKIERSTKAIWGDNYVRDDHKLQLYGMAGSRKRVSIGNKNKSSAR
jgi:hypothetical protein